jgi:nitroreductase
MERRWFFAKTLAVSAGIAAAAKGTIAWAKSNGLPSDPGTSREEISGPDILLPQFDKDMACTLEDALLKRKTSRSFDPDKNLTIDQLSRIMWAANGVNREDGHTTVPSAMAYYPVIVYVAIPEGVYRYDNKAHKLVQVSPENILKKIAIQPGLRKATMKLLYVYDKKKAKGGDIGWGDLEIGCMVQSAYLEAGCMGLGSTVFAIVQYDKVEKYLDLKEGQKLRIAQAVAPVK